MTLLTPPHIGQPVIAGGRRGRLLTLARYENRGKRAGRDKDRPVPTAAWVIFGKTIKLFGLDEIAPEPAPEAQA